MKKHSSGKAAMKRGAKEDADRLTIGLDLGDQSSRYCVLSSSGEVVAEGSVATNKEA